MRWACAGHRSEPGRLDTCFSCISPLTSRCPARCGSAVAPFGGSGVGNCLPIKSERCITPISTGSRASTCTIRRPLPEGNMVDRMDARP